MVSTLYTITEIRPESAWQAENALWGWYTMHAPGDGTKLCCIPELMYLGLGSEEKALSSWIATVFINLGAQ